MQYSIDVNLEFDENLTCSDKIYALCMLIQPALINIALTLSISTANSSDNSLLKPQ